MQTNNTQADAPAPAKPRAKIIRWLETDPTPFGGEVSQAGNAKFGRLAELQGKEGPVKLRVVGVMKQWACASDDEVELYRCADGSVGAQPAMVRDAAAPASAFDL